jgi:hypothetical protein
MLLPGRTILAGMAGVVAFDAIAAFASRALGFPYTRAAIGSYLFYFAVGFFAARASRASPLRGAAVAAALVALTDASAGWWVSSLIGPGRPTESVELTVTRWAGVALAVVTFAVAIGTVGGLVGREKPGIGVPVP